MIIIASKVGAQISTVWSLTIVDPFRKEIIIFYILKSTIFYKIETKELNIVFRHLIPVDRMYFEQSLSIRYIGVLGYVQGIQGAVERGYVIVWFLHHDV